MPQKQVMTVDDITARHAATSMASILRYFERYNLGSMMMSARRVFGQWGAGPGGRFFAPGELRLALLALIVERPGHGYELMSRLEDRFDGVYQASAGAVYPTLAQLEDEGLIRLEVEEGRKVYHATDAGVHEVTAQRERIEQIWARAASRGEWGVFREPEAAEIVAPALRMVKAAIKAIVHAHGDPGVVDQVRTILDDARQQIERLDRRRSR
jgi:DNA-binding PadR family transcriptional regulator